MTTPSATHEFMLGDRPVRRMGFGAMQLAGPGVFGPPRDRERALAILRTAIASGVNHIDTSDYYGPHIVNQLIREALSPYPDDLVIVTKVGGRRGADGSWIEASAPAELRCAVEDNLRHLGLDALDVVNMRFWGNTNAPAEGAVDAQMETLAKMREEGLIRHIGLSNVTPAQVKRAQAICPLVCVQNHYNIVHRHDDALVDQLAVQGIAYVPFFPLGGFSTVQSERLDAIAARLKATPMQVALAWLLHRSPSILLIPGTSSPTHLAENLAAATLSLDAEAMQDLNALTHPENAAQ